MDDVAAKLRALREQVREAEKEQAKAEGQLAEVRAALKERGFRSVKEAAAESERLVGEIEKIMSTIQARYQLLKTKVDQL